MGRPELTLGSAPMSSGNCGLKEKEKKKNQGKKTQQQQQQLKKHEHFAQKPHTQPARGQRDSVYSAQHFNFVEALSSSCLFSSLNFSLFY